MFTCRVFILSHDRFYEVIVPIHGNELFLVRTIANGYQDVSPP